MLKSLSAMIAPMARYLRLGDLSDGPRRFLAFLLLNVISWQCLIGPVLVLHARALGIDRSSVGVLFSLLYFAGGLGVLTKPLAEKYGSKRVLMAGWTARNLLVLPIVLTPLALKTGGVKAASLLLFTTIALYCITRSLAGIAWSSWLHEIVPPRQLGHFFSLEMIMTTVLTVVFGVFAFAVLGRHPGLWHFAGIAGFGVFVGLASLRLLHQVPGGLPENKVSSRVHGSYRFVFRDRMFMSFMVCSAMFSMAYASTKLLLTLTLRDRFGIGAGTILLLTTFGNIIAVTTTLRWRRVADHHGSPLVMAANGLLAGVCLLLLGIMSKNWGHYLLPLVVICALIPVAETGNHVSVSRGYMLRMRPHHRHAYNAVWGAFTQITTGIATVLVGFWLNAGGEKVFRSAALGMGILSLAAMMTALRLPVPRKDSVEKASKIFNPKHPFLSLGLMLRYVLKPARTTIKLDTEPMESDALRS